MMYRMDPPRLEPLEDRLLLDGAGPAEPVGPHWSPSVECEIHVDSMVAAETATYYVSPDGSAAGDGSEESPWRTVQEALETIGHGGVTIVLLPGIYEPIRVRDTQYGGTADRPTVIRAAEKWTAIVEGLEGQHNVNVVGDWYVIEGLEVRGSMIDGIKVNGNHCTVRDNWVHHSARQGIGSHGYNGTVIEGNLFEYNGTDTQFDHGIYVSGANLQIAGNVVRHNAGYGIHLWGELEDCFIVDNLVYGHSVKLPMVIQSVDGVGANHIYRNTLLNPDHVSDVVRIYGDEASVSTYANHFGWNVDASLFDALHSNDVADYAALKPEWFVYGAPGRNHSHDFAWAVPDMQRTKAADGRVLTHSPGQERARAAAEAAPSHHRAPLPLAVAAVDHLLRGGSTSVSVAGPQSSGAAQSETAAVNTAGHVGAELAESAVPSVSTGLLSALDSANPLLGNPI